MHFKKRFFIIVFFFFFIAPRGFVWGENKKLTNIKNLYITSIKLNAVCDDKRDVIRFPDIGFVGPSFLKALLSNFQRNNPQVELSQGLFASELKDYRKKIFYDPSWVYFENNFNLAQLKNEDREILRQKAGTLYELVLDLQTSLWEQKIAGRYIIYHEGLELHSGKLKAISTYIIKDKYSPYVTAYDSEIDQFQNPLDHQGEIKKIYQELGGKIGNALRALFIAEVKVEKKKKENKTAKKKKQRRRKGQFKFWDLMKPQY